MGPLLAAIEVSGDIPAALTAAGLTFGEVYRARAADPVFDRGMCAAEELVRIQAAAILEARAAAGDGRALSLLLRRGDQLRELSKPSTPDSGPVDPLELLAAKLALRFYDWLKLRETELDADAWPPPHPWLDAIVCPHCQTLLSPWWTGPSETGGPRPRQTLEPLVRDAWRWHRYWGGPRPRWAQDWPCPESLDLDPPEGAGAHYPVGFQSFKHIKTKT